MTLSLRPSPRTLPLAPLFALALTSVAGACSLQITDFKESASEATGEEGSSSTSEGSGTTTEDGSTTETSTGGSTTGALFPACDAYTEDPEGGYAEACAEELGCASRVTEEDCVGYSYRENVSNDSLECRWGNLFVGSYDEMEATCIGEVKPVCRAVTFFGEGGVPCAGYHRADGETSEVYNLNCGTPIAGDFDSCYLIEGEPDIPGCSCFPPWP